MITRLVDAQLPPAIEAGVCEGLSSPLLLPPLAARMTLLYALLPKSPEDWGQLSRGQVRLETLERKLCQYLFMKYPVICQHH